MLGWRGLPTYPPALVPSLYGGHHPVHGIAAIPYTPGRIVGPWRLAEPLLLLPFPASRM